MLKGGNRQEAKNQVSDKKRDYDPQALIEFAEEKHELGATGSMRPSRAGAQALLGTCSISSIRPANDDEPGLVPIERYYRRRKPRQGDLRCNTTLTSIHPIDYEQARIAFNQSFAVGLGLDTAVTIRPAAFRTMTKEARYDETRRLLKRVRSFYADNDDMPPLAYLLARETEYGDEDGCSEHLHLLIHTGEKRWRLKRYLHARYTKVEAKVKPASQERVHLNNGQIGDASTYSLKAVSAPYARKYGLPHRYSGPVYGARVFWSKNINPVRPRIRIPNAAPQKRGAGKNPREALQRGATPGSRATTTRFSNRPQSSRELTLA